MAERLKKIRELLEQKNVDAVIITNPVNRRYLSGFDGTDGVLLISHDKAYLVTDFRYVDQAAAQAPLFTIQRWKDDLYKSLALLIEDAGWIRLGFESKHVVYSVYGEMSDKFSIELIPLDQTAEKQRIIKSDAELDILRRGAKVTDRAFEYLLSLIKAGMSEKELALGLEIYLLQHGAEKASFRFIVASGKRGAMPHGTASEKTMSEGELVTIDFGAIFEGYATDMTRTVALGSIDKRGREIYGIVYKAQEQSAAAVKAGMQCSEVDAVARDIISEAGYGNYFGHGLGHGVGLETHEQPVLNSRSETILEQGMVATVEPGIYLPDWGGVRIEDMVCVTDNGPELLTKSPRELIII